MLIGRISLFRTTAWLLAALVWMPLSAWSATNSHVILITIDGLAAYYLRETPQAPLPTLRRLANEGAVAESLHVSNPTTTWPNHTTLVTGVTPAKHAVLFNGRLIRGAPGQAVRLEGDHNQSELIAVPTIYDRLHRAGGRTAAINWPCTRGAETLDDNFPDAPDRISQTTTPLRAELIRHGILEDATDISFLKKGAAAADQAWMAAALHLLQNRPPQLLLIHLLATDDIQHRYGPKSPAAYTALALADALVADLVRVLETTGLREQTSLIVVSDHGFARPAQLISPNVVLRRAGWQRPGRRRAQSISEGGTAFVYLTEPKTEDGPKIIEALRQLEGIEAILEPAQFGALGLPVPSRNPQVGDLLLVAREGYAFSDEALEDDAITPLPIPLGSHGYLATDPQMNGVFVAWGRRIKPGMKLSTADILDVAPTIAELLGISLPGVQGKVLAEILSPVLSER
jgi:predicted AlkP superfamily pyrophosphatase or phosphodiesterase